MDTIKYKVSIEHNPTQESKDILGSALYQSDALRVGSMNFRVFAAFLRDTNGRVFGGGLGTVTWNWVYINWLWIEEELRGQGWGREIITSIEKEASKMDCGFSYLNTFDFQGLGFYQKLGYEIFGELDQFPKGHKNYYLKKNLLLPNGNMNKGNENA